MSEPLLKAGDEAVWNSQSAGIWRKKHGKVICVVHANRDLVRFLMDAGIQVKPTNIRAQRYSSKDRYAVVVNHGKRNDLIAVYAPPVALVDKQMTAARERL